MSLDIDSGANASSNEDTPHPPIEVMETEILTPLPKPQRPRSSSQPSTSTSNPSRRKRPLTDSDGFTTVSNGKRSNKPTNARSAPRTTPAPQPTPTSNQFEPLRSLRPPPIVFPADKYAATAIIKLMLEKVKSDQFEIQTSKKEHKLLCFDRSTYETTTALLEKGKDVHYYTHAPRGTKPNKKYLIFGLDLHHKIEDIKSALNHPDLIDVRRLTKTDEHGNKTPTAPILVTFKPDYKCDEHLKTIAAIDFVRIHFKPYHPEKGIPQCHKCQAYGHTKKYCHLPPKCVRCSASHDVANCDRTANPLRCINCGGDHPASFRACSARVALLKQHKTKNQQPQQSSFIPAPPPTSNCWFPLPKSANPPLTQPKNTHLPQTQPAPSAPLLPTPSTEIPAWATLIITMVEGMMKTMMSQLQQMINTIASSHAK